MTSNFLAGIKLSFSQSISQSSSQQQQHHHHENNRQSVGDIKLTSIRVEGGIGHHGHHTSGGSGVGVHGGASKIPRKNVDLGDSIIISIPPDTSPDSVQEIPHASSWKPEPLERPLKENQQLMLDFLSDLQVMAELHHSPLLSFPSPVDDFFVRPLDHQQLPFSLIENSVNNQSTNSNIMTKDITTLSFMSDSKNGSANRSPFITSQDDFDLKLSSDQVDSSMDASIQGSVRASRFSRSLTKSRPPSAIVLSGSNIVSFMKKQESFRSFSNSATASQMNNPNQNNVGLLSSNSYSTVLGQMETLTDGSNRLIFTSLNGGFMTMASFIPYRDSRKSTHKSKAKAGRFTQIPYKNDFFNIGLSDTMKRRRADSYSFALAPTGALESIIEFQSTYNPFFVDDPELKMGKHRTVMTLACFMGSILQYSKPVDIKKELNEHFKTTHPNVDNTLTLSQIRKIKSKLLEVAQSQDLELASVASAYVYFEKLALKGVVNKLNRRLVAATCLMLAAKVTDTKELNYPMLLENIHRIMEVSAKDVLAQEFATYAALDFSLFLSPVEVMPHLERIMINLSTDLDEIYGTTSFYLGKNLNTTTICHH